MNGVEFLQLNRISTGCILLGGLFVYDIFWVSCWLDSYHHIISGFGIYGAAVVPDTGVDNTWQRLTLVLHQFLSNGLTPSRLHIVISFLTHADHVFLGLPRSLVPGSPNRVMELMHVVKGIIVALFDEFSLFTTYWHFWAFLKNVYNKETLYQSFQLYFDCIQ